MARGMWWLYAHGFYDAPSKITVDGDDWFYHSPWGLILMAHAN